MAINAPSISFLRGYDSSPDIVGKFGQGFGLAKGIVDEQQAAQLMAALGDSFYSQDGNGSGSLSDLAPMASDAMVSGSHSAADKAADPVLTAYFANTRRAESGGNDTARNPKSSATGRYQFLEATWNDLAARHPELGLTPDGRTDPGQQEKAIRVFTQENAGALQKSGVPVTPGALYAAHFLGAGGAPKVLQGDPNSPVSAYLDPAVMQANPHLNDMTVADFKAWADKQGGNGQGGYAAPSVAAGLGQSARLPPRELMSQLLANPVTRPYAIELAKSGQAKSPTADIQEYQYALSQGYRGSFADWQQQNKSGVTVNTGDNSSKFTNKADELAATRMDEIVQSGAGAQTFMGDLQALTELGKNLKTGKEAEIKNALGPYAEMFGINIADLGEGQAYDAIISRMAPQMRVPGSGASSDFDAKQFLKSLPSLGNTPEGNQLIIDTFSAVQDHKVKAAEIASLALDGTIKWQEADRRILALGDPFSAWKKATKGDKGGGNTAAPAASGDQPPAGWGGDPALWPFMTPEERALWN